jgi:hypothetical protein
MRTLLYEETEVSYLARTEDLIHNTRSVVALGVQLSCLRYAPLYYTALRPTALRYALDAR